VPRYNVGMRRLFRILFHVLCLLFAAVSLACISLWIRSYYVSDSAGHMHQFIQDISLVQDSYWGASGRGLVWVNHNFGRWNYQSTAELEQVRARIFAFPIQADYRSDYESISAAEQFKRDGHRLFLGFGFTSSTYRGGVPAEFHEWQIIFPYAAPAVLFSLPLLIDLRMILKRKRRKKLHSQNLCLSCGYDLRASPDHCPECGAMRQPAQLSAV